MEHYDSDDLNIQDLDDLLNDDSPSLKSVSSAGTASARDAEPRRDSRQNRKSPRYRENEARSGRRTAQTDMTEETKADYRGSGKRRAAGRGGISVHVVLLIAIAAAASAAVILILVWNRGIDIHINPSDNAGRYNVEVNDSMVYLTDEQLAGHDDDGITTILCLGDEPFSYDESDSGLAGQIAALGGDNVTVINASFPSSQVTCENSTYQTGTLDEMDDIFNLFYVSYAISIGDFSSLETVASVHNDNPVFAQSVQALKDTDFGTVDMIAIMYDASDYINGASMQNPDNPDDLTTYVSSLSNALKLIQNQYPYIRIVFLSPYYAEYEGSSGRTTDRGNGTITNYFQWAYDTCADCGVSFLDNYYGSVNENNYEDYTSDGVHLNSAGCTKIADHFVWKVLQDNYAEYNVEEMAIAGR